MSDPANELSEHDHKVKARKNLTYLLLFAIVMFFVALSSAYVVTQSSSDYWVHFRIPTAFYISTAVIVVSSITIQLGLGAVRKGKAQITALWLVLTVLLGGVFTGFQRAGWSELMTRGYHLTGGKVISGEGTYGVDYTITRKGITLEKVDTQYFLPTDTQRAKPLNAEMEEPWNASSGFFYVLTVGHWVHLAGGLIVLLILAFKALMGRYSAYDHTGVWQGTLYWHFLAGLWIYLLLFIAFVH
jgi:cytochrome c oxidase subunit III